MGREGADLPRYLPAAASGADQRPSIVGRQDQFLEVPVTGRAMELEDRHRFSLPLRGMSPFGLAPWLRRFERVYRPPYDVTITVERRFALTIRAARVSKRSALAERALDVDEDRSLTVAALNSCCRRGVGPTRRASSRRFFGACQTTACRF